MWRSRGLRSSAASWPGGRSCDLLKLPCSSAAHPGIGSESRLTDFGEVRQVQGPRVNPGKKLGWHDLQCLLVDVGTRIAWAASPANWPASDHSQRSRSDWQLAGEDPRSLGVSVTEIV